jgi:PAS domain S-box-containing protein
VSTLSPENASSSSVERLVDILGSISQATEPMAPDARQRAAVLAFGRRAAARPPLPVLFNEAARLTTATLDGDLIGVGEVGTDGTTLTLTITPIGAQDASAAPVTQHLSLGPQDSMAGYALANAAPVATAKLAGENRFADPVLRKLGVVTALTVPLHLDDKPYGSLGIYRKQEHAFTQDDVRFAETIGQLLASSIARVSAEQQMQQMRTLFSTVLGAVDALILRLDMEGRLIRINRVCQQCTGFSLREIQGKLFCNVFVVPGEIDLFQRAFRAAVAGTTSQSFSSDLLTKDGRQRHIGWTLKVLRRQHGGNDSILLSGTDRTELVECKKKLQETKTIADDATRSLKQLRREMAEQESATLRRIAPTERAAEADSPAEGPAERDIAQPGDAASKSGAELRTSPRLTYRYKQWIAPIYGRTMPSPSQLFQVTCENISAGGIAFYLENAPAFDHLVVGLGQPPDMTYFRARTVRVMERELDGRRHFLVGCRFTGRVDL